MTAKYYILALIFSSISTIRAQGIYDASKIPAALIKGSDAVVRDETYHLNIKSQSSATMEFKKVVTVLSKSGDNHAVMFEYYDKFSSLYNLKATLYNASGTKIKSYKASDFKDQSLISEGTMYDDNRMKTLNFYSSSYPYTVEYSYEKDYNGYLGFEDWRPVSHFSLSIEKSSFTVQIAKDVTFRYLKNPSVKTDSSSLNNKLQYQWSCENIPAMEYEPMTTGLQDISPWVMISPNQFDYDHSRGAVDTWKNLGTWIYQTSSNVQTLPQSTRDKVKALIENAKTDQEKIAILYKYLQSNTRYVSVQLGIGGFIPIAADRIDAVKYGDCKALSNYMKSLLEVAGISSNLVMLGSDMPSLNPAYSSFGQANHMILCVPLAKDTTWLECTSQYMPAGFLGNSTANKIVLLATAEGGKLVKTPSYQPEDNFQNRFTSVALSPEGNADINIRTAYGACQYETTLGLTLMEPTEQRKTLMNSLDIPNMEILSASFSQPDKNMPKIEERLSLKGSQLYSQGGDKLFLTLNMLNRKESVPRKIENRKTSFALPYGFKDMDEITYILPAGYKAEFIPKDVFLESEFGKYTARTVLKDNTIVYTRIQTINSKKYPADKYSSLVDFYRKIYLADKQKAVLAKVN